MLNRRSNSGGTHDDRSDDHISDIISQRHRFLQSMRSGGNDDNDDVLQQEQFMKSGAASSVRVVSKTKRDVVRLDTSLPSIPNAQDSSSNSRRQGGGVSQFKQQQQQKKKLDQQDSGEEHEQQQRPWILKSVLTERKIPKQSVSSDAADAAGTATRTYHALPLHRSGTTPNISFPVAEHRDKMGLNLARRRRDHSNAPPQRSIPRKKLAPRPMTKAGTLDPSREEIDRASDQMLQNMTENQIQEALLELQNMRPDLLEGIRARVEKSVGDGGAQKRASVAPQQEQQQKQKQKQKHPHELQHPSGPLPTVVSEIAREPFFHEDKRLQSMMMSKEEYLKLQWMADVDLTPPNGQWCSPKNVLEARFDLEGIWIDAEREKELSTRNELFHHGDEPHRPGYTLEEVVKFGIRSTVTGQRIIHLNLLSNLLIAQQQFDHIVEVINYMFRERSVEMVTMLMNDRNVNVSLAALRCFYALCSVMMRREGRTLEYYDALSRSAFRGESVYSVNFSHLALDSLQHESKDGSAATLLLDKLRDIKMPSEKDTHAVPLEHTTFMQMIHILVSSREISVLDRLAAILLLQMQNTDHDGRMQDNTRIVLDIILDLLVMTYSGKTCSLTMVNQFVKNKVLIQTLLDMVFGAFSRWSSDHTLSMTKVKMLKVLTAVCLYSRQFTMEIISEYKIPIASLPMDGHHEGITMLEMCKRQILSFQAFDEGGIEEDPSVLQIDIEILRFLAVCVSYGFAWEVCHQACFAVMSRMVQYAFRGGEHDRHLRLELASSVFHVLQNFVLASVDPSSAQSQQATIASREDMDNIVHLRFFVEDECLVLLQRAISDATDLDRLHMHANMLHFVATYYQRLPATASHMQHTIQSIKRIEVVFSAKGLLESLAAMLDKSCDTLLLNNGIDLSFKRRLCCFDIIVSVLRFVLYVSKVLPQLHTTAMTGLLPSLMKVSQVIDAEGRATLSKALQRNGFRKMHYRIELWMNYFFIKCMTFSTQMDPQFNTSVMSAAIRAVEHCIWIYRDTSNNSDANDDAPSEDMVIVSDALMVLLRTQYPLLFQFFRAEFGLHNIELRKGDFDALRTQLDQYAIQSHCLMSVTYDDFHTSAGADSQWPFTVVERMFQLQHSLFESDRQHSIQLDQRTRLLIEQLSLIDSLERQHHFSPESCPPIIRMAHLAKVYLMHQSSTSDSILYFQDPDVERLMKNLLIHFYRAALSGCTVVAGEMSPQSWRFDPFGHLEAEKKSVMEQRFFSMIESLLQQFNANSYGNPTFTHYVTLMLATAMWPFKFQQLVINEICIGTASIFLRMKSMLPTAEINDSSLISTVKEAFLAPSTDTRELATHLGRLLLQLDDEDDVNTLANESNNDLSLLDYAVHHIQRFIWCLDVDETIQAGGGEGEFSYPLDRFHVMKDIVFHCENISVLRRVLQNNNVEQASMVWSSFVDRLHGQERDFVLSRMNDIGLMIEINLPQ